VILSNDLLFVHVPKTAGTSVRDWLLDHLRPPILHVHHDSGRFDGSPGPMPVRFRAMGYAAAPRNAH